MNINNLIKTNKNEKSIFQYIKNNRYLYEDLKKHTSYLDNCYLRNELSQRLYHHIHNLKTIPKDRHGWYKKYMSFSKGYSEKLQPVNKQDFKRLSEKELLSYIKSAEHISNNDFLISFLKKKTHFLDDYDANIATRITYIKENINHPIFTTEKHETLALPTRKTKKHIIDCYRQFIKTKPADLKEHFFKKWVLLTGNQRKLKTRAVKCIPLILEYINNFKKENNLQITDPLQIAYHIAYNITKMPTCCYCKQPIKETQFNNHYTSYPETCSVKCCNKYQKNIEKRLLNNHTNINGYKTNIEENEEFMLYLISKIKKLNIQKTQQIGPYFVDGIDSDNNIIIEIQEKHHLWNKTFEKDKEKFKYFHSLGYKLLCVFDMSNIKTTNKQYIKYINYFSKLYSNNIEFLNITPASCKILTKNGWSQFAGVKQIEKKQPVICLNTYTNKKLYCTHEQIIFLKDNKETYAKNINVNDEIQTIDGIEKIKKITTENNKIVYDIVETNDHTVFCNDILIHQCIILDECVGGETLVTVRNKKTKEIMKVPIEQFYELIS